MGFYFVNIIHSNMLLLCVLIFIIGLINMNFSCKGAFGALWRIAEVYEGVTKQRMSGAMSGPWHWTWYVRPLTLDLICHKMEAQNSPTQCISGAKSGFKSGAWYVMKIYICIEFQTSKTSVCQVTSQVLYQAPDLVWRAAGAVL